MNAPQTPDLRATAARLDQAATSARPTAQLGDARLDLSAAYRIQQLITDLRLARGDGLVGAKLGFTSAAKARQMGVADVIFGRLHAFMEYDAGACVQLSHFIHPRVEPEIAFRLGAPVSFTEGSDPADQLREAIDAVAPALEIIDSRYIDFRFSLVDVVADNTSAAGFVVGGWQPADLVASPPPISDVPVELTVDGELAAAGRSSDILGDPYRAVPALARLAQAQGVSLPEGAVLLAGAATEAVALAPGTRIVATVPGLGTVSMSTAEASEVAR